MTGRKDGHISRTRMNTTRAIQTSRIEVNEDGLISKNKSEEERGWRGSQKQKKRTATYPCQRM